MDSRNLNLLDEALGLNNQAKEASNSWPLRGKVILIEDCVETSGSFVLHHLIKRILSPNYNSSNVIIFIGLSNPFSHYDRVLRKLGCNLAAQKDGGKFFFFDMFKLQSSDGNEGKNGETGFISLFGKIQKLLCALPENYKNQVTIMIDDVSLMEVAAYGSSDHAIDFLHYCHTLTSDFGCSLVTLNHKDIYSAMESPSFLLQMEYFADVLVKAEPLATGLAADVHGQLTVLNMGIYSSKGNSKNKTSNFQFMVKENSVEYFYPGSRT
ncbi:elongator complex protein 6 [Mercurialis annua]|uniref:elongator complex protein 6 n=1 Tax=Mercurialis annua TaxID=3986 RepID=UPI00215EAAE8|nr:elongator complex protein 6 [Mercurialis annua]XP_050215615.1 elongator complex protein 6 [Mercurialis annua]XP_050215616.1 elongator complex protein 6 [Mercurialis annua]